ncbi:MAG: hypothetical protein ACR2Q4_21720 [Geminicoccaceae bacterium]
MFGVSAVMELIGNTVTGACPAGWCRAGVLFLLQGVGAEFEIAFFGHFERLRQLVDLDVLGKTVFLGKRMALFGQHQRGVEVLDLVELFALVDAIGHLNEVPTFAGPGQKDIGLHRTVLHLLKDWDIAVIGEEIEFAPGVLRNRDRRIHISVGDA